MRYEAHKVIFALICSSTSLLFLFITPQVETPKKPEPIQKNNLIWHSMGHSYVPKGLHKCSGFDVTVQSDDKHPQGAAYADLVVWQAPASCGYLQDAMPKHKPKGQFWVLETLEPPRCTEKDFDFLKRFDIFSSYRGDCGIPSYQHTYAWTFADYDIMSEMRKPITWDKKDKNDPLFFVAANCKSRSGREYYVKELMEYISVSSYGDCLNNKDRGHYTRKSEQQGNKKYLYKTINDEWKNKHLFYLALENSNCEDYITEKYWKSLYAGLLPIVDGPDSYEKYLPAPNSVIRLDDFESPKHLAEYIKYLVSNRTAYMEYFPWKTDPKFVFPDTFKSLLNNSKQLQSHRERLCEIASIARGEKEFSTCPLPDKSCKHGKWIPVWYKRILIDLTWYLPWWLILCTISACVLRIYSRCINT